MKNDANNTAKINNENQMEDGLTKTNHVIFKVDNLKTLQTNKQMIKNILLSIGVWDTLLGDSNLSKGEFLSNTELDGIWQKYIQGVAYSLNNTGDYDTYDKAVKYLTEKNYTINKMEHIIKYLMRVYNSFSVDDVDNYQDMNDDLIPKIHPDFTFYNGVKLDGNFMKNQAVLDARIVQNSLNKADDELKTRVLLISSLLPGVLTGGSNGLSRNNIYSSINFNQSGGDNLPATAGRIRNVLTRWVSGGLISVNIENLLEIVQDFLGKNNKSFDKADLDNMKKALKKLKVYEFDLLKLLVYINYMLKMKDVDLNINERDINKYVLNRTQTGGTANLWTDSVEKLVAKLQKKAEGKGEDIVEMIKNLQTTVSEMKTTISGNIVNNFNELAKDGVMDFGTDFANGNKFNEVTRDTDGKLTFTGNL
jgi:hypothetical protein